MVHMSDVTIVSAFIAGLLSFLAPCTFPLVPAYLGFLAGDHASAGSDAALRRRVVMMNALLFVVGFTSVFMLFGLASGFLGKFLVLHRTTIAQVGGAVVILFGLAQLRIIRLPNIVSRRFGSERLVPGRPISAFLLGLFFGFGWSPCLGPILGTILLLAGTSGSLFSGAFLLFVYSLGIALPFLLLAYFYGRAFASVVAFARYLPLIERISGVFLVAVGLLLVLGKFGLLNVWIGTMLEGEWYERLMDHM